MTLTKAYYMYKKETPNHTLCQRKFEVLCPKNIKTQKFAQRMVCCCTIHTNFDYIRNSLKRVVQVNGAEHNVFNSNEELVNFTLCKSATMQCITRTCTECGTNLLDKLKLVTLYCSRNCMINSSECKEHSIKELNTIIKVK